MDEIAVAKLNAWELHEDQERERRRAEYVKKLERDSLRRAKTKDRLNDSEYWITDDGRRVHIQNEMSARHAENCVKMLRRESYALYQLLHVGDATHSDDLLSVTAWFESQPVVVALEKRRKQKDPIAVAMRDKRETKKFEKDLKSGKRKAKRPKIVPETWLFDSILGPTFGESKRAQQRDSIFDNLGGYS